MVNLLVVAALLGSSLASYTVDFNVSNFQVLCMKKDGRYFPISNSPVAARLSETFNMWVDPESGSARVDDHHHSTDRNGYLSLKQKIKDSSETYKHERFQLWIDVDCTTFRRECPAVENFCQFSKQPFVTLAMVYPAHSGYYQRGAYALITPQQSLVVDKRDKLPKAKMTLSQFCEPPKGIAQVHQCHFSDAKKRSSSFNKGRPARFVKSLV